MHKLVPFPKVTRLICLITLASFLPSSVGAVELLATLPDPPEPRELEPITNPLDPTGALRLAEAAVPPLVMAVPTPEKDPTQAATEPEQPKTIRLGRTMKDSLHSVDILEKYKILIQDREGLWPKMEKQVQMAQLADQPTWDIKSESAGSTASAERQAADSMWLNGDYAGAAVAYVNLLQMYPRSDEALAADRGLERLFVYAGRGEVPLTVIDAFDAQRPSWETYEPEVKYILLAGYNEGLVNAVNAGNSAAVTRFAQPSQEMARAFLYEHPNDVFIQSAVEYYYDSAKIIGTETFNQAVAVLETSIRQEGETNLGPLYRIAVLSQMSEHYAHVDLKMDRSVHYSGMLAAMASDQLAENLLNDPTVYAWVKGRYALAIGTGCRGAGDEEAALKWYERGIAVSPEGGATVHWLGLRAAQMKTALDPSNPAAALATYNDYLLRYPDNTVAAPYALMDMAGIYLSHGDYAQASVYYNTVVNEYPETDCARMAQSELAYIATYFEGTASTAAILDPATIRDVEVAQLCGPYALQKFLALKGIVTTLEDLALLADADANGVSMAALVTAAASKGVTLNGIQESDPAKLEPPFIAHVDGDHFVLVRSREVDNLVVEEIDKPEQTLSQGDFAARWDGFALVADTTEKSASLSNEQLTSVWGGTQDPDHSTSGQDPEDAAGEGACGDSGGQNTAQSADPGMCKTCPTVEDDGETCGESTCPNSPQSTLGINSPGVTNPRINNYYSAQEFEEEDIGFDTLGARRISFRRFYKNPYGFPLAYGGQIGKGWSHNYNNENSDGGGAGANTGHIAVDAQLMWIPPADSVELTWTKTITTPLGGTYTETFSDTSYADATPFTTVTFTLPAAVTYTINGVEHESTPTVGTAPTLSLYISGVVTKTSSASVRYRMNSMTDHSGNESNLIYDTSGRLQRVNAPSGDSRYLLFTYDGSDRITKVQIMDTGGELQKVDYTYNGNGELTRVTDDNGDYVEYAYGADGGVAGSGYISKITDKAGAELDFAFAYTQDAQSNYKANTITVENEDGLVSVFDRSHSTSISTNTNWDGSTQLTKIVNTPLTNDFTKTSSLAYYLDATTYEVWTRTYSNGKLASILAPGSVAYREWAFDTEGRVSGTRKGTGPWTYYGYPNATAEYYDTITGPDGLDTEYTFDGSLRTTKITHPSIGVDGVQYTYDSYGHVATVTDPLGNVTTYTYDSVGNLATVTDPESNVTTFTHDALGNVLTVTDPRGKVTEFTMTGGGCGSCGGGGALMTAVEDALNNVTKFEYDVNGNMTKVTDALARETDYEYDALNRLVKITSPSGSANEMTFTYNILGQLVSQTDFDGKTVTYAYDHMGRVVTTTDAEGDTEVAYNSDGTLASVTDGLNHTTSYAYDTAFRLTTVTDPISKVVKYFYDSAGRMSKVGAGSTGAVDPTEYFYSNTTGLLETVRYTSGANTYDADYYYDDAARLEKLTDWIDGTDGLQYEYDDAGRLTTLRDYDGEELTYVYDAAGNITSMTDYHGNTTTYTYTDLNQVDTITAPGSKVWDFDYNALGQPTAYDHPNGMTTEYTYDAVNRLSKIDHKDGANTKQSFEYTLTNGGNISRVEHEDGVYWDYEYDGRNRLTSADRVQSANIVGEYRYTYDDGDNMLTRSEPFFDDFNDADYTGWSVLRGTWTASNAVLHASDFGTWNTIRKSESDPDKEISFRYRYNDTANANAIAQVYARYNSGSSYLYLRLRPGQLDILENVTGHTMLDTVNITSDDDTWYNVRMVVDDTDLTVWRWADGDMPTEILQTTVALLTSSYSSVEVGPSCDIDFDDIRIISDDFATTTTFTYNNANELTGMTMSPGGTTNFTYDDWGRMTQKTNGGFTADYAYRYGSMLYNVDSDFIGEGEVTYEYGGDLKRRIKVENSISTLFRYDDGWGVRSEENEYGQLERTYIGQAAAYVNGLNPSTGDYVYLIHDVVISVRGAYSENATTCALLEYSPYGNTVISSGGFDKARGYTSHAYAAASDTYYAPFRQFDSKIARWTTKDPLGDVDGTNKYQYANNNPMAYIDPLGLMGIRSCYKGPNDPYKCKAPPKPSPREIRDWWNGNHPGNFERHCGASCEMAYWYGKGASWLGGWWNEQREDEGSRDDWHNNKAGRDCGVRMRGQDGYDGASLVSVRRRCLQCCNDQGPSDATGTVRPLLGPLCSWIEDLTGWDI